MRTLLAVTTIMLFSCAPPPPQRGTEDAGEGLGEHGKGGEGADHREAAGHDEGGGEGEEDGVYIGADALWDGVRKGIRLTLMYDGSRKAFHGTVQNTSDSQVCAVRVEVHLKDGGELGPTDPRDLGPGESAGIELVAPDGFEHWTAHPETSACPAT